MRKLLFFVIISITWTSANAQMAFGPEAGLNLATLNENVKGTSINGGTRPGIKLGVIGDRKITPGSAFYLQPGVFVSTKGADLPDNNKLGITYIELSANAVYKFKTGGGSYFFVGAGPYLAFAVGGKVTTNGSTGNIKIGPDETVDNIKQSDFGIGFQAGYQFKAGLFVRLQYQAGLTNIAPTEIPSGIDNNFSIRNDATNITAGWLFASRSRKKLVNAHRDL